MTTLENKDYGEKTPEINISDTQREIIKTSGKTYKVLCNNIKCNEVPEGYVFYWDQEKGGRMLKEIENS